MNDKLEEILLFPTMVYKRHMPQFVDPLKRVASRYLTQIAKERELDCVYPLYQTWSFHAEPEAEHFVKSVLQASWECMMRQGYNLNGLGTAFQAAWFQDHHRLSSMEKHSHGDPAKIVGFYFLEVPEEKTPWLVLDDPRPGKTQSEPPVKWGDKLEVSSPRVSFRPQVGDLYLTPAWLPHALTRNGSDKQFLLAHLNVMLVPVQMPPQPQNGPEIL